MLLPALTRAKLRAQQTYCLNNERQLVTAFKLYYNDFTYLSVPGGSEFFWYDPLGPYGVTPGALLCPTASLTNATVTRPIPFFPGTADRAWFTTKAVGSYGFNVYLIANGNLTNVAQNTFSFWNRIPAHPSETPVFADSVVPAASAGETGPPATNLYTGEGVRLLDMCSFTIPRHGKQSPAAAPRVFDISQPLPGITDIGFYDGHVEPVHLENLWNYYWSANWIIPNPRPR